MALAHYPNAIFLRQSLFIGHHLPLWSPLILSGSPFFANPLSGLWYPPGWLALILPLPPGFNLLAALHLLWGGIGMYLFLRSAGLPGAPAFFAALGFETLPKLYAHYGAGHLTLLYAIAWTPWLLWACRRRAGRLKRLAWNSLLSWEALILALIFLADVRWSAYAALLWWGYALFGVPVAREGMPLITSWLRRLTPLFTQTLLAACLAAALALPLVEYTRLSTRAQMGLADTLAFSLPWPRLLGLAFPDFNGFHEYMLYGGQAVLLLAVLAGLSQLRLAAVRFWLAAFLLSLTFALGANLPFMGILTGLPLFDLLRVPSRMLFVSGIALLILAAYALQALFSGLTASQRRRVSLALTAVVAFELALCGGVWIVGGKAPLNFVWGAGFALAAAVWIGLYQSGRIPKAYWLAGGLVMCLFDWGGMDRSLFWPRAAQQVLSANRPLAQYLAAQGAGFRVYSPSYSLAQQTAADFGLQLADGVDPLQLQAYASFMEQASGAPAAGYSVTLPPFANGEPASDNALYRPDARQLGLLNVRYVAAEFDLPLADFALEKQFGGTRLYRNLAALPRAWVQPEDSPLGEGIRPVEFLAESSDRIHLRAEGPGLLLLSEVNYPGWQAWVDDRSVPVETAAGLLRSLRLPSGEHRVEFGFRPTSLYLGWGLSLAALIFWVVIQLYQRKMDAGNRSLTEFDSSPLPVVADEYGK